MRKEEPASRSTASICCLVSSTSASFSLRSEDICVYSALKRLMTFSEASRFRCAVSLASFSRACAFSSFFNVRYVEVRAVSL